MENALGKPIDRQVLSIEDLSAELSQSPDDIMLRYRAVFAIGRGMWWNKDKTFNVRRGFAVTDAKSWLHAHLADKRGKNAA